MTTKIHLACDGQDRPLAITTTAGSVNDCTQFEQALRPTVRLRSTSWLVTAGRPAAPTDKR
ncbi:transposase [Streptomyces sp. NPDC014636]|uniref:transposase n=1 Tax=Streptomyces sp. NPDC014636 TaxID=3364876 RepID=UPI0036FB0E6F